MTESRTFYTSVKPELKKAYLYGGTFCAICATLMLVAGGVFLKSQLLTIWGMPLFFIWILFVSLGMIPYRKLANLEDHPDKILIEVGNLVFFSKGEAYLTIPLDNISQIDFMERRGAYGLGLLLKYPAPNPVIVHVPARKISKYQLRYGYDLFFPFFSQQTANELKSYL